MAVVPHGTMTFLFTDVEGSTRLWEQDREAMRPALATHGRIVRGAIEEHDGYVFSTAGDAFSASFSSLVGHGEDVARLVAELAVRGRLASARSTPMATS